MNLDLVGSALCALFAISMFSVAMLSSPRFAYARTMPDYLRSGAFMTGLTAAWRAFDFLEVALSPAYMIGHINAVGVMVLIPLVYFLSALAYWVCGEPLSHAARARAAEHRVADLREDHP